MATVLSAYCSILRPSLSKFTAAASFSISATMTADKVVVPAIIVGGGRVGRALHDMGTVEDVLIKRGETVPVDFKGPILACTRNDDLEAVLHSTPKSRWSEGLTAANGKWASAVAGRLKARGLSCKDLDFQINLNRNMALTTLWMNMWCR